MNRSSETFLKTERLCSTKIIRELFESGYSFYTPLFRVVWEKSPVTLPFPAQVAFSVSKKAFRLAVTRNLLKRRMRESYRKLKNDLYHYLLAENTQLVLIIIFRGSKIADYNVVEKSMKDVMTLLVSSIKDKDQKC